MQFFYRKNMILLQALKKKHYYFIEMYFIHTLKKSYIKKFKKIPIVCVSVFFVVNLS